MTDKEWLYSKAFGALVTKHDTFEVASVTLATAIEYGEHCRREGRGTCKNLWGEEGFRCSECGASSLEGFYCDSTQEQKEGRLVYGDSFDDYKYCPCCGAEVVQ